MGQGLAGIACALAAIAIMSPGANAQAVSAPAKAHANILQPITVRNVAPLSFGNLSPGVVAGTATLSPAGTVTYAGGVSGAGGDLSAARFLVTTRGARLLKVTFPTRSFRLFRVGGGATMQVSALIDAKKVTRIDVNADLHEVVVGGTLSVSANQMEGVYEGEFEVTFDHN